MTTSRAQPGSGWYPTPSPRCSSLCSGDHHMTITLAPINLLWTTPPSLSLSPSLPLSPSFPSFFFHPFSLSQSLPPSQTSPEGGVPHSPRPVGCGHAHGPALCLSASLHQPPRHDTPVRGLPSHGQPLRLRLLRHLRWLPDLRTVGGASVWNGDAGTRGPPVPTGFHSHSDC